MSTCIIRIKHQKRILSFCESQLVLSALIRRASCRISKEDNRKLQAFRLMYRHDGHSIGAEVLYRSILKL